MANETYTGEFEPLLRTRDDAVMATRQRGPFQDMDADCVLDDWNLAELRRAFADVHANGTEADKLEWLMRRFGNSIGIEIE